MRKQIFKFVIIFSSLLFSSVCFAAGENNELVKMDLNQTSDGSVRLNIYTDKPYNDRIIVNQKPDNKYVILLPETVNSMNYKPDVSNISGLNNVDIKTKQYSSLPGKGYTKITIDTQKPLNIVPQAYVVKKVPQERKSKTRPYVSPQQVQMTVPQRVLNLPQRPVTNNDFLPSFEHRPQNLNAGRETNYTARPRQSQQIIRHEEPRQYVQPQVQQQAESNNVRQNVNTDLTSTQNQVVSENTPDSTQSQQQESEELTNNGTAVDDVSLSDDEEDISENDLAFFKKIIKFKQKLVRKIKKLLSVRISFSSFMTVLQFILLVVLVKIIGDLLKRIQYPNESQSQPVTRRLIHNNDETFERTYPSYSNMDVYNTNRSTFEEDNKEGFNVTPLSSPISFSSQQSGVQKNLYSNNNYRQPQPYSGQSDFYKPLSKISEEEKMSIFDENANEIEKTIFRNPLTSISKQDEESLFDEIEPTEENSPFNSEKDSDNDDFFNYANTAENEEDFFIFEDDDEEDEDVEYQEDYIDDDEEEYEDEYDDDEYEESEEYTDEDVEYSEQISVEPKKADIDPFEHLSVNTKYVIDSNRGFAHVNVDGINALIGYVGSKISVIRKFKEDVKGTMQVRLNEQADAETMIYIIKLGSYKTLVEVKPDSIRQLLDL